ncbi:MAG: hypothetical protein R8J41_08585 [Alphaproteobacteria bacterium]|nr:hypothetical protein [Alphaproteobacteria bacterium]
MLRFVLVVALTMSLGACAAFRSGSIKPIILETDDPDATYQDQYFDLDGGKLPGQSKTAYEEAQADPIARNLLQDELIRRSNRFCAVFKDRIYLLDSSIGFSLQSLAGATAIASTVVGGKSGAEILSATAGTLTGTNAIFDSEFLQNQFTGALVAQINKDRTEWLKKIRASQSRNQNAYTVAQAITEVQEYHYSCTIISALSGLQDSIRESASFSDLSQQVRTQRLLLQIQAFKTDDVISSETAKALSDELVKSLVPDLGTAPQKADDKKVPEVGDGNSGTTNLVPPQGTLQPGITSPLSP